MVDHKVIPLKKINTYTFLLESGRGQSFPKNQPCFLRGKRCPEKKRKAQVFEERAFIYRKISFNWIALFYECRQGGNIPAKKEGKNVGR